MKIRFHIAWLSVFTIGILAKWYIERNHLPDFDRRPRISYEEALRASKDTQRYTLGFDATLAATKWVELLQEADHRPMEGSHPTWEFVQLAGITTLDPRYRRAYEFGSAFLSVLRQDKEGARLLLKRWTEIENRFWRPHYLYGYHLYAEMNDFDTAAKEMLIASELPRAPTWLSSLGVRLLSEAGATMSALDTAIRMYPSVVDPEGQARLRSRIRALRTNLEQTAWNQAVADYRRVHRRQPRDLAEVSTARGNVARSLAGLPSASDIHEDLLPILRESLEVRIDTKTGTVIVGSLSAQEKKSNKIIGINRVEGSK